MRQIARELSMAALWLAALPAARATPGPLLSPDGRWLAETCPGDSEGKMTLQLVRSTEPGESGEAIVDHAETLTAMKWSCDSGFLVLTFDKAAESDNPVEFHALVFCMADGSLRDLSGYFPNGFVAEPAIGFEGDDAVVLSIQLSPGEVLPMHAGLKEAASFLLPLNDNDGPAEVIEKTSPDGTLKAVALRTTDPGRPSNRDGESFRLTVYPPGETETGRSIELRTRRGVDQMRWSPDSKFLVLTTSSSGGHSPMNETTFVYCREDGSLRRLSHYRDDTFITRSDIGFTGANTAILGVCSGSRDDEYQAPQHTIAVRLEQEFLSMPQESSATDPDEISPVLTLASRDRKWFAAARSIPDGNSPWRTDLDRFRLVVRTPDTQDSQGDEVLRYDGDRQRVAEMEWSPDDRYLVITTRRTDGETRPKWNAWVWCADDGSLRSVPEDILDGVLDHRAIHFSASNILELYVLAEGGEQFRKSIPLQPPLERLSKVATGRIIPPGR